MIDMGLLGHRHLEGDPDARVDTQTLRFIIWIEFFPELVALDVQGVRLDVGRAGATNFLPMMS